MNHVKSSGRVNFYIWGKSKLLVGTKNIPLVPDQVEYKLMIAMKLNNIIADQRFCPKFPTY